MSRDTSRDFFPFILKINSQINGKTPARDTFLVTKGFIDNNFLQLYNIFRAAIFLRTPLATASD